VKSDSQRSSTGRSWHSKFWVGHGSRSWRRVGRQQAKASSDAVILYTFDPRRNAVLLVAGDKAGKWESWYRQAIPLAEQRYEDYLKQEDI
jgi:hypothetical protein